MKYVVEYAHSGDTSPNLYGPFNTEDEAIEWARGRATMPWTVRAIHVIPDRD